jgi:hypothetical protein
MWIFLRTNPTASLMRNDLLNIAAAHGLRSKRVIRCSNHAKRHLKSRALSDAVLSDAVELG